MSSPFGHMTNFNRKDAMIHSKVALSSLTVKINKGPTKIYNQPNGYFFYEYCPRKYGFILFTLFDIL